VRGRDRCARVIADGAKRRAGIWPSGRPVVWTPGAASGRTSGGCRESWRCRGPCGVRTVRMVAGAEGEQPPVQFPEEAGEVSAIGDDGPAEFVPEWSVELVGHNAEVTADIGNDGADRAATYFGGDFRFRGEARESRVLGVVGGVWLAGWGSGWASGGADCRAARGPRTTGRRMGGSVRSWPRAARRQSLASRAVARRRPLVMRPRMAARSAVPKGLANREKPGAAARCWTVPARCLP
jgi:hypothetical protein